MTPSPFAAHTSRMRATRQGGSHNSVFGVASHRTLWGAAVVAASLALTSPSRAVSMLETVGAPGSVTPFSAVALPSGPEVTYFNPALLVDSAAGVYGGVFFLRQSLSLGLNPRPEGIDIPVDIYGAKPLDGGSSLTFRPLATSELRSPRGSSPQSANQFYYTIGLVVHALDKKLAFGAYALLPATKFQETRGSYADEREQYFSNSLHFELLGDRVQTNIMTFALAARPWSFLALGTGIALANDGTSANSVYVPDAGRQDVSSLNTSLRINMKVVPHFGIDIRPWGNFHISSTVHLPYRSQVQGQTELQLWNYNYVTAERVVRQSIQVTSFDTPLRLATALSYRDTVGSDASWRVSAGARYTRWSQYRDRHSDRPLDRWFDTMSPTIGGALDLGPHTFGLDFAYVPSPVPDQVGRTNYVDNSRLAVGGGMAERFTIGTAEFQASLQLQVQRLLPRSAQKSDRALNPVLDEFHDSTDAQTGTVLPSSTGFQTNNPGYPGFRSSGWILGMGASLSLRF